MAIWDQTTKFNSHQYFLAIIWYDNVRGTVLWAKHWKSTRDDQNENQRLSGDTTENYSHFLLSFKLIHYNVSSTHDMVFLWSACQCQEFGGVQASQVFVDPSLYVWYWGFKCTCLTTTEAFSRRSRSNFYTAGNANLIGESWGGVAEEAVRVLLVGGGSGQEEPGMIIRV